MIRMMTVALALGLCCAATPYAQTERPATRPTAEASAPLNLNTATQAQLEALPGIGASTAMRILEYRQKNGGFKKIEETLEIRSSCPYSLSVFDFGARHAVSRSR
ncbi:MAG: helix-hairpin-helix domain-containing protein [Vicinamibacterales bacterium]